jgi:hypothetical protein
MIKNIYLQSLILAIFIFLSGIMFGIWIDNYRLSAIRQNLLSDTVFWDDSLFLSKYSQFFGQDFCDKALNLNLLFNEKIYKRGIEIENAVLANKFAPEMREELKKYTLMQAQFWLNSIDLKKKCNFTYHTVVHLQMFNPPTPQDVVDNKAQANIMLKLKEECGNKIMLIPLYADLNLTTIDAILVNYNVKKLPAVIVDETHLFQGLTQLDTLKNYVGC